MIQNEDYSRKVLPFLKDEYFTVSEDRALFTEIKDFIVKYSIAPTYDALSVEINKLANLSDMQVKIIQESLKDFKGNTDKDNEDWLLASTEEFCQDKAIYLGLMQSIEIANANKGSLSKGAIPQIMTDAVGVTFSTSIGHDYLEQFEDRYEFYHQKLERVAFDLEFFNKVTGGGLPKKTLNIILAGCVHPSTKVKIRFRKREAADITIS